MSSGQCAATAGSSVSLNDLTPAPGVDVQKWAACGTNLKARGLTDSELWVMLHTPAYACPNVGVDEARIRAIIANDWDQAGCTTSTKAEMLSALETGKCGGDAGIRSRLQLISSTPLVRQRRRTHVPAADAQMRAGVGISRKRGQCMQAYILLDRSGSMQSLWVEALSSVNAYAKELANKTDGPAVDSHITLAVFDEQAGLQFDVLRRKQPALHWDTVTDADASRAA